MPTLVDTSVLIEVERRGLVFSETPLSRQDAMSVSAITASELLFGLHSARTNEQLVQRQSFYDDLLREVAILPFDVAVAEVHARLWYGLRSSGSMIGLQDLLIVATALANGHTVLTYNVREFARIPDLGVREPVW